MRFCVDCSVKSDPRLKQWQFIPWISVSSKMHNLRENITSWINNDNSVLEVSYIKVLGQIYQIFYLCLFGRKYFFPLRAKFFFSFFFFCIWRFFTTSACILFCWLLRSWVDEIFYRKVGLPPNTFRVLSQRTLEHGTFTGSSAPSEGKINVCRPHFLAIKCLLTAFLIFWVTEHHLPYVEDLGRLHQLRTMSRAAFSARNRGLARPIGRDFKIWLLTLTYQKAWPDIKTLRI